ncbi:MAG TPA: helix-turn-helix transcriptional regulator [Puia sp.]|nr:helix-turn-helix transcriptional regulator [Puia sp.]
MNDGEKIKILRMIKNYSQSGIAKKLGITRQAYSKMENEQTKVSEERMQKILKILQCTEEDLKNIETFHLSPKKK